MFSRKKTSETSGQFKKSRKLFLDADNLHFDNQPDKAKRLYKKAMASTNSYGVFYHVSYGQIHIIDGNLENALTEFEIALSINETIEEVHINMGLTYRKMAGQCKKVGMSKKSEELIKASLNAFEVARNINPKSAAVNSTLALTYVVMGRGYLKKAEEFSKQALEVEPDNYLALTTLAQIRQMQNNVQEAKELVLRAIKLYPNRSYAYVLLGQRGSHQKKALEPKTQKAIGWLQKAIKRDPGNTYAHGELAKAYVEIKNYGEALKAYNCIVDSDDGSNHYGPLANRGNVYLLLGKLEKAEKDLKVSLSIKPDFLFALITMRQLKKEQKQHEEALKYAEKVYAQRGNSKNRRELDEIERLFGQDIRESISITRDLIKKRDGIKSEEIWQKAWKALDLFSENFEAMGIIGHGYYVRKNLSEARRFLQKSLDLVPRKVPLSASPAFYKKQLGMVLLAMGNIKGAEREFGIAKRWNPRDRDLQSRLEALQQKRPPKKREKKVDIFTGSKLVFINYQTGREEQHSVDLIEQFLYDRMRDWQLPIQEVIEEVGDEPVFIIAKTGVGKTVTVPTKVLLSMCDELFEDDKGIQRRCFLIQRTLLCTS